MVAQDVSVNEAVRLSRIASSNRPESLSPTGRLNQGGDGHVFAYSGNYDIASGDNTEHVLLDIKTDTDFIKAETTFWRRSWEDDDILFRIYFGRVNDASSNMIYAGIHRSSEPQYQHETLLIFPPHTRIIMTADKQATSYDSKVGCNVVGEVI